VTGFQPPTTSVSVNPGRGLTWSLSGAGVSVHGDWSVRYHHFIRDHGSFDASASGASISVSVTLDVTSSGEPTIRSTGCSCHIDHVSIRLHGGASWLYNLFRSLVERPMRENLQRKVCEAAQNAVNTDAARELATLPVRVALGRDKRWLLDYRLVSEPAFSSGFLESFHKGEFFAANDTSTEAPFQPPSTLPSPPSVERMVTYWASSYVVNTAGYVLHHRGVLRHNLTRNDLPQQYRDRLNTSCGLLAGCIGALVPAVGKMYPNASVEVELFSTGSLTAGIDREKLIAGFAGVAVLRARLSNGSLAHLFSMNVTAKIAVTPRIDGSVLKASVGSMEQTLAVVNTSIGPISTTLLGLAFDVAKNTFIIPKLNKAGEMGFPLPATKNVKFTNMKLQLEKDCVRVSADFTQSSSALYFHP